MVKFENLKQAKRENAENGRFVFAKGFEDWEAKK
jgi:hypothetical protein